MTASLDGVAARYRELHWFPPVDRLRVGALREGYHESRRCSRDTYPESYITKYTSIRRLPPDFPGKRACADFFFFFITLKPRVE